MSPLSLISFTLATLLVAASVDGSAINDNQQRSALEQLSAELENELSAGSIKDYVLGHWLKKHNFDVQDTVQAVRKYLQYRKEQKLDQILEEDWDDLRTKFPYTRNTFDKSGRPVLYADMGQWDVASYLSSAEPSAYDRYLRYNQMMLLESEQHVRQLRADGQDVSQYVIIYNGGGFSPSKHACIQCAYAARDLTNSMVSYAPVNIEKTVVVNVPFLYKMIYSLFGDEAQSYVKLYGQDQTQWENMLLEYIDRDQFPKGILEELDQKENTEGLLTWNKEL